MNNKNKEIQEVENLRLLVNMFPYFKYPQDERYIMSNAIHLFCSAGADKIEELLKQLSLILSDED